MEKYIPEKYKKYLPSKSFSLIMAVSIGFLLIIFIILFIFSKTQTFLAKKDGKVSIADQSFQDLLTDDTDGDGVANWEEALWGTNKNNIKTFEDIPDSDYINNKKKEIQGEETKSVEESTLTETDKFAREFFTSFAAMKASGEIDDSTINSFSNALGAQLVVPSLIDAYTMENIKKSSNDTPTSRQQYYQYLKTTYEGYISIGRELEIISSGLTSYSDTAQEADYTELNIIADEYADFADKIIKKEVPASIANYALRIANGANNTGISVRNMTKIISDPIIGLSGLSAYQKYNDELIDAVSELNATLQ